MAYTKVKRALETTPVALAPPAPAIAAESEGSPKTWGDKHGVTVMVAVAVGLVVLLIAFNMN